MKKISWKIILIAVLPIAFLIAMNVYTLLRFEESPNLQQGTHFPHFTAQDIYGNTVTDDIFEDNFSVVYLWVTNDADINPNMCSLMTKLTTETAKPIRFVGIVGDAKEDSTPKIALARSLAKDLPSDMIQIIPNDDMMPFLQNIHNAPFVCFVDEDGNFVGQPIVGNEPKLMEKEATRLLTENHLAVETAAKAQKSLLGGL